MFGVSHSDVHKSVGFFIDAVNASENFKIKFPTYHSKQREIAQRFKELSEAEFDCCAGAVDGMLVWTHAPTLEDILADNDDEEEEEEEELEKKGREKENKERETNEDEEIRQEAASRREQERKDD